MTDPLKNPQSAALKMVAALQAVVDDKLGMTEDTYRKVLGALYAAGVDPFPPPTYRAVHKPSYYNDGRGWWVFCEKDKGYLCTSDGEFARFETEELANEAIAEEVRSAAETGSEFSASKLVSPDEPVIVLPRTLITNIVAEQPPHSEVFSSCLFCGSADYRKYPRPNANFYQHAENCDWVKARRIICESAGSTGVVSGILSAEELRNYLRHRGFNLVSKMIRDRDQSMLFAYSPTEIVDEATWADTISGLELYFVSVDDNAMSLSDAQYWCDTRLSGRPSPSKVPG